MQEGVIIPTGEVRLEDAKGHGNGINESMEAGVVMLSTRVIEHV